MVKTAYDRAYELADKSPSEIVDLIIDKEGYRHKTGLIYADDYRNDCEKFSSLMGSENEWFAVSREDRVVWLEQHIRARE